jgi:hypothetical protein
MMKDCREGVHGNMGLLSHCVLAISRTGSRTKQLLHVETVATAMTTNGEDESQQDRQKTQPPIRPTQRTEP